MPSLPEPISCGRSLYWSSCLDPIELSVQRIACRFFSSCRPVALSKAAFCPLTIVPPREYISAVKCQPPTLAAL